MSENIPQNIPGNSGEPVMGKVVLGPVTPAMAQMRARPAGKFFYVNWQALDAMANLAGEDETRHAICGVRIECLAERQLYVSTDGRVLGVMEQRLEVGDGSNAWMNLPGTAYTVNLPVIEMLRVLLNGSDGKGGMNIDNAPLPLEKDEPLVLTVREGVLTVASLRAEIMGGFTVAVEGRPEFQKYPQWRHLFEGKWVEGGERHARFDLAFAARLHAVFERVGRAGAGVHWYAQLGGELETNNAYYLVTMNNWKFAALVMPQRMDAEPWDVGGLPAGVKELIAEGPSCTKATEGRP